MAAYGRRRLGARPHRVQRIVAQTGSGRIFRPPSRRPFEYADEPEVLMVGGVSQTATAGGEDVGDDTTRSEGVTRAEFSKEKRGDRTDGAGAMARRTLVTRGSADRRSFFPLMRSGAGIVDLSSASTTLHHWGVKTPGMLRRLMISSRASRRAARRHTGPQRSDRRVVDVQRPRGGSKKWWSGDSSSRA